MSAKVDVFMPLYLGDYLKDTLDLDAEEHGAYLLLLMELWNRGGELPGDHARLTKIARVKPSRWMAVWETIGRFFTVTGEGKLTQKRAVAELEKALRRKNAGAKAGTASAAKRQRTGDAPPTGDPTDGQRSGNESSTTSQPVPKTSPSTSHSPSGDLGSPSVPDPTILPRTDLDPEGARVPSAGSPERPTGLQLQRWWAQEWEKVGRDRTDGTHRMSWTIPRDAQGKADSFALEIRDEDIPFVRPSMRLAIEHIWDRARDWVDPRMMDSASYAFACWRNRFDSLVAEARGQRRSAVPEVPVFNPAEQPR